MSDDVGGAPSDGFSEVEARLGVSLPEPLRAVYSEGDGRFRRDGEWWVVWPLDRLVLENVAAWKDDRLPRALLAFGDDGTGNPFCLHLAEGRDEVLRWSWIDAEVETSEGSIHEFIREWVHPE